jgi:hypothetical protein
MITNNSDNIKVKLLQVLVALGSTIGVLAGIVAILQFCGITLIKPPQSVTFICGMSRDGVPTTFARELTNGGIPKNKSIIRWVSDFGTEKGYDQQKRCEEVSNRFQDYSNQRLLNYITTGKEKGLDTICVAKDKERGGPCLILLTLKPGTNPNQVLHQLLSEHLESDGIPLEGSNVSQIYIDVNKILSKAPVQKN